MIDWDRVNELKDEVGNEAFAEVAEMFVAEVDEAVSRLRAGARPAQLHGDLHFLKGAALNLGFSAFANLCRDGEAAAAGDTEGVDLGRILSAYEESRTEFVSNTAEKS